MKEIRKKRNAIKGGQERQGGGSWRGAGKEVSEGEGDKKEVDSLRKTVKLGN